MINFSKYILWGLIFCFVSLLSSCDKNLIYENEGDCESGLLIRFIYDYNMEYANAFHNQVDCLEVFVYDEDGKFITSASVEGDELKDESYRMRMSLPGGIYHIVAFGGMGCEKTAFSFSTHPAMGGERSTTRFKLNEGKTPYELHPLFYGTCGNVTVNEFSGRYTEATVSMIKDTNSIRVLLQQISGKAVDHNDFDFKLVADNCQMNHDNKVLLGHPKEFSPWVYGNENPGSLTDGNDASVAWSEFSIPRIVNETEIANLQDNIPYEGPRLEITYKKENRKVVSIPLINYLLLCKPISPTKGAQMSDQEFLDRESRYNLFFFLNEKMEWVSLEIQVADWVVRVTNKVFD